MSKIRIHELAKELGKNSKDIMEFLKAKNVEAANHMSTLSEEEAAMVRKGFSAKSQTEGHKKTKAAIVFRPQNSTQPIVRKKPAKPQRAAEDAKAEKKEVKGHQEHTAEKPVMGEASREDTGREKVKSETVKKEAAAGALEAQSSHGGTVKKEEGKKPMASENTRSGEGERRESHVSSRDNGREVNRDSQRDNGRNRNRENRDGQRPRREGGFRDGGQRREGGFRGGQNRDGALKGNGQNGSYRGSGSQTGGFRGGQSRDGSTAQRGNSGQNFRSGQGSFRGGNQGRDGGSRDGRNAGVSRREGGFQRREMSSDAMAPTLSKNEVRGGKPVNKKERELREKSKQFMEKNGRRQENTKSFSKMTSQQKKPQQMPKKEEEDVIKTIVIPEVLTIKELAEKMKQQPSALVKKLFLQGTMVTINSEIDFETAEEVALDFNYICEKEEKVDVIGELLKEEEEPEELMQPRPPVVCVMGHVDHGKTSLLDAIRSTNVTSKEAGGITQHIGAYVVKCNDQNITFLDTPGHEAFTAMRMRGAQATDIAILVVAADDGVMPQTVEAISHAKAAGVDIIVAINKIDKPSANVERVKQEVAEQGLVPEDWGGDTIFVPVSAHTHEGIDTLLEMILLVAEVKELKANPNRRARGIVIEAELDKGRGSVATILVQKGTLHVGDAVAAGSCHGKIRAMIDDKGRRVKEAGPSTPVEILGLNGVPNAGEIFVSTESEKEARNFAETFISEGREKLLEETKAKLTLDGLFSQIQAGNIKELNIVIKADVQGSVEAVKQSLLKLSNDEVVVKIIHGGVGAINESDVTLAATSNAIIIGFNVRPDALAKQMAEREKVDMRLYRVIYQAIEDVQSAMKGMLDPVFEEKVIGHAVIRQIFKASGVGNIAGSYVTDGVFQRACSIRIFRDGEKIYEGALASLKRFKDDVKEVKEGYECGLVFEKFNDIQEDDTVEAYTMVEVPR